MYEQELIESHYCQEQRGGLGRDHDEKGNIRAMTGVAMSRSPNTSRRRPPRKATEIIHATTMNANAKIMRIMARNRQETGPLDVKMASY